MDEQLIQQQLEEWIVDFVEKPNPLLNNWPPCPYARQSRLANQIHIVFDSPFATFNYVNFLNDYDVVVLCFDPVEFSSEQVITFTKNLNSKIMPMDYVVLEDHPDSEESINGVKMNFGKCGLMILQHLSKLNLAAEQLQKKGYYNVWSSENLDQVVNWRYIS